MMSRMMMMKLIAMITHVNYYIRQMLAVCRCTAVSVGSGSGIGIGIGIVSALGESLKVGSQQKRRQQNAIDFVV